MAFAFFHIVEMLKRAQTNRRAFLTAHTSAATLSPSHTGSVHTNLGASGTVTLTLPSNGRPGDHYTFVVVASQNLRVDPSDSMAFYLDEAKQTDGKYVELSAIGTRMEVVCDGSDWYASVNGTFQIEA